MLMMHTTFNAGIASVKSLLNVTIAADDIHFLALRLLES